ncbi:response regulator [Bradyrhizobium sp. STM 3809]|uniref:response regulator n=1 Tax=Bradyrhizobium sp. STM 3809 TaxID=551936 RepID=UPI000A03E70C|nr:response regulator [Bradyrhizobium sp. STM 3809]
MSVLLVEDDEFKATDILKVLEEKFASSSVVRATSVTSALKAVNRETFALIVLDMSLPTFEMSGLGGGGSPQGQGGLEVLRLARRLKNTSPFIVVTQYPDIELDGVEIPLPIAAKSLRTKFDVNVLACLLYEFDRDSWRSPLRKLLTDINEQQ